MAQKPFTAETVIDALNHFEQGMNSGVDPDLLPKQQLAFATNATLRGTMIHPRPPYRKITLGGDSIPALRWQGACYYNPDQTLTHVPESLVASIGGRLWQLTPDATNPTAVVTERTIVGDPNPAANTQAWLWQAEKWVIVNDGVSNPLFFDGATTMRSNYNQPFNYSGTLKTSFLVPAIGAQTAAIDLLNAYPAILGGDLAATVIVIGDILTFKNFGQFSVQDITPGVPDLYTLLNLSATPTGKRISVGTPVSWQHFGQQLPPGRMAAYGLGRNWECLVDGKQFVASDLVSGSSGTAANNYRDAVLYITENTMLASGGNFTVPGSVGDIRAMVFSATLDKSLGQGPLSIFTATSVFTCEAPADRTLWQTVTNPIVTQALIAKGAEGQYSTVLANSDILFRMVDGVASYVQARRDFDVWGNVPISLEMDRVYNLDKNDLLPFGTATVFDNRHLMSASPQVNPDIGVYHLGLVALNFDPVSSLRGKLPSIYDGLWTGLNILQLVTGMFSGTERAFAFCLNTNNNLVELWEIQTEGAGFYDNGNIPIVWSFETPTLNFGETDPRQRSLKALIDGEIYVDKLVGTVTFQAFYRTDQYPCWVPWLSWEECAQANSTSGLQFRPRMGLGEPSGRPCDLSTNRPLREGYDFQFKLIVTGQCQFRGARFKAVTRPEPQFAAPSCKEICK